MREVTKEKFYAVINPQDVVYRPERDAGWWETRSRRVIGKTVPGYMCRDSEGRYTEHKTYFLAD